MVPRPGALSGRARQPLGLTQWTCLTLPPPNVSQRPARGHERRRRRRLSRSRGRTSIRRNMCRPSPSACSGSPASPARPAWRWCWPTRPPVFRRWPLYPASPRSGRRHALRLPAPDRRAAGRLAGEKSHGRAARSASIEAAYRRRALHRLEEACARTKTTMVAGRDSNLIDKHLDRPAAASQRAGHGLSRQVRRTHQRRKARRDRRKLLKADESVDALVVSALDSLAWLFNIRGDDVEVLAAGSGLCGVGRRTAARRCASIRRKITAEVRAHLGPDVGARAL